MLAQLWRIALEVLVGQAPSCSFMQLTKRYKCTGCQTELLQIKRIGGKAMEIENILALMRHKRANMVQTAEQYKFCYRMLLELYEGRRSLVSVLSILKPRG